MNVPNKRKSTMLLNLLRVSNLKKQMRTVSDMAFDAMDDDGSGGLDSGELAEIMGIVAEKMQVSAPG